MPKVKQCAQKSKKKNFAEVPKFASQAAEVKYHNSIRQKDFYVERGIMAKDANLGDLPQWLIDTVTERNWETLCSTPKPAVPELVKEFYSNFLVDQWPTEVTVRGTVVPFSDQVINDIFLLESVPCEFSKNRDHLSDELIQDILPELAKPESDWDIDDNGTFRFRRTDLHHDIKCLYSFVQSSFLPTSHDSTVSRERMWMLYCIMKGMPVDIGSVL
ncbi:uncharacterized protein LOC133789072 [Humulus lupulus]|uniref:uncharacterized protein LOC133789072 n=1 Tax=Humulus lupulus TaxID=3486 RepID=UPI002B406BA5|nr:uncharacterized protein LOC133789072 [Humulus lupulus]